jgi:hypothetical protein
MNKLPILNKWAEYAADILINFPDVFQDFVENTSRNSRQYIADKISFRQKLIRIIGCADNYMAQEDYFLIDQLYREDRYYRFYDC